MRTEPAHMQTHKWAAAVWRSTDRNTAAEGFDLPQHSRKLTHRTPDSLYTGIWLELRLPILGRSPLLAVAEFCPVIFLDDYSINYAFILVYYFIIL